MNKIFKRIFLLICAVILFSSPSVVFATQTPILIDGGYNYKMYIYDKPYYTVPINTNLQLKNTTESDEQWHVPSGKTLDFSFYLTNISKFDVVIVKNNDFSKYISCNSNSFHYTFESGSQCRIYLIPKSDNVTLVSYIASFR